MSNIRILKNGEYVKSDILFFERPLADLKKFAFKIAPRIKQNNPELILSAIAIEMPKDSSHFIDYYVHWNDVKTNIDKFLVNTGIKLIVFSNWRIPDLEFILHAKKLGIKTILIQEGLVYSGISINDVSVANIINSFTYFLGKSLSYINTMIRMCRYDNKSVIYLMNEIIKQKKDITLVLSKYYSERLLADYVLIMGNYWKRYYGDKIGYCEKQMILVGDHDLDDFEINENNEKAICYIATVLVEDGTVSRKDFLEFISSFVDSISNETKIYIKLHPRSDHTLYSEFDKRNVEYIEKAGYLPSVNLYIGHRGSLIGKALYESDNLILYMFPNEKYCFYEKFATYICRNKLQLKEAIKSIEISEKMNNKRDTISEVYWKNPSGAINSISKYILSYLNKGKLNY